MTENLFPSDLEEFQRKLRNVSKNELVQKYGHIFERAKQSAGKAKSLLWTIDPLLPEGGLIILAGRAKEARKSLTAMEMCKAVATGEQFLGFDTREGEALFCNFEDGIETVRRRARMIGMLEVPGDPPFSVMCDHRGLPVVFEYIRLFRPKLVVFDPLMEVEIAFGIRDENSSAEVSKIIKRFRDVGQENGTTIMLPHHYLKGAQEMRGSSALQGSTDGWINIYLPKAGQEEKGYTMAWTNRHAQDGSIHYRFEFEGEAGTLDSRARLVQLSGVEQHDPVEKGRKKKDEPQGPSMEQRVGQALLSSAESLSVQEIAIQLDVHANTIRKAMKNLLARGEVRESSSKQGRTVVYECVRDDANAHTASAEVEEELSAVESVVDDVFGVLGDDVFEDPENAV